MAQDKPARSVNLAAVVVGAALVGLGLLFLLARLFGALFHIDIGHFLWPFWVIVPGVLLYILGLAARDKGGLGLAIAGSVVTMVGLILLFQAVTGLWATWAYAWALIAPASVGLGMALYGALKRQPDLVHSGARLAAIGLVLFLAFGIFFELIIGISGFGLGGAGKLLLPILVIGIGIAVLAAALLSGRRRV